MIDKLKNYAIVLLLLCVIGAYFYGKSQVPDPPALEVKASVEAVKSDSVASSVKAVSVKKTTNLSGNKKEGTYAKSTTEDFLFESEDSVTISTAKYNEMESIIKNTVLPSWGLSLGVGKERDVPGEFYSLGYLHAIGKNLFFMGDIGIKKANAIYELENGRASVIKLF